MEIHKPKPWHGVREFGKELLTIILGVLLALGAEQLVEALHHREIVARGEESLKDNFDRFIRFSVAQQQEQACLKARGAELSAILDQAAATGRLPAIAAIPQPSPRPWQIDTWEAMVASGAAPYLPQRRAVLYSRIAMSGVDVYAVALKEWDNWGALKSLAGPSRAFGPAEAASARETLARAISEGDLIGVLTTNTVRRIRNTGLLTEKEVRQGQAEGAAEPGGYAVCPPLA